MVMSFLHKHEKIIFRLIVAVLRVYDLRKAVSDAIKMHASSSPPLSRLFCRCKNCKINLARIFEKDDARSWNQQKRASEGDFKMHCTVSN